MTSRQKRIFLPYIALGVAFIACFGVYKVKVDEESARDRQQQAAKVERLTDKAEAAVALANARAALAADASHKACLAANKNARESTAYVGESLSRAETGYRLQLASPAATPEQKRNAYGQLTRLVEARARLPHAFVIDPSCEPKGSQ